MKLAEFLVDLEQKEKSLGLNKEKIIENNELVLTSEELKSLEDKLFSCDEFKNVVRINYINNPTYMVDEESGEPIAANREFLGGKTKVRQISEFRSFPESELKFNKIVDLYSIRLNKRYSSKEDITKPGLWIYPTTHDEETFEPTNQIRVIWNPDQLKDTLKLVGSDETPKKRLLRMFEASLDSMEPNIPCEYIISIKCSSRSIVVDNSTPTVNLETPIIEGIIPPVEINTEHQINTDDSVISK